jgi:hypothetical protein
VPGHEISRFWPEAGPLSIARNCLARHAMRVSPACGAGGRGIARVVTPLRQRRECLRRSDMLSTRAIGTALVAILLAPVPARADTLLIPFFGVNFGGDSGKEFSEAFDTSQYNWGVSIAFMGGGVFGFEGDIGFSPDFYGKNDAGGSNVLTATGNLVIGIPFGGQQGFGIRPYGLVGAGLLKSKSDFGTGVAEIDETI